MATGRMPFEGESSGEICGAILHKEPTPPAELNPQVSAGLGAVIDKAVEKDRDLRYQHASEIRTDLQRLKRDTETGHTAVVSTGPQATGSVAEAATVGIATLQAPSSSVVAVPTHRFKWAAAIAGAAVVVLGLTLAGWLYFARRAGALTNKDTIILSDFENKTGDALFDDTLRQGLSVQLEQSPFLSLISDSKANQTLKLMGRSAGDRLTPEVTREVCQRTGGKAMVSGSIAGLGSQFVIGLKAVNCQSGDTLAEAQQQAPSKEAVLKALDTAAATLRGKLGESLSSVQRYGTPLEEATTPSLEALKAYSLGRKTAIATSDTAALPFYKRAVELDPNFAMAYRAMSAMYGNLNEDDRAAENGRKAFELRGKVSERERLQIESTYYFNTTGELEKAAQASALWLQTYPKDTLAYTNLGLMSDNLGNYEQALEEAKGAMRLDPDDAYMYVDLTSEYMNLNRLEEAEAVFKQAEERKLEDEYMLTNHYQLAFLKGDTAQMTRWAASAMGKPGAEDLLLAMQADTAAWHGELERARELTRRAVESAQHNDAKESAAMYQAAAGLREAESGNREQARANVNAAVKLSPNRGVRAIAALVSARAGDMAVAEKLAAELDKAFPLNTLVQRYWLPTIRAGVALQRKNPDRAIELLQASRTIELGEPTQLNVVLCPVYLRGDAYLMLQDGNAAAAEFQKFIDHRGLVANFPWGALARLGLARAYAMQGDSVKAKAAYQEFLTIWKDADADIPIYKQAKAEYAKLQ
jgi:tetratricopeptide (TPR) repeat protein